METLERDLREQHLRFLEEYGRLQDGSERESLRALAEDPAAFGMYQGATQALCAIFNSLGRSGDGEGLDRYAAIRRCMSMRRDDQSTKLLHRQLDILRRSAELLHGLVTTRGIPRREMPTAPSLRQKAARGEYRLIGHSARFRGRDEDLPVLKFELMQSLIDDLTGKRYCMVSRKQSKRPPPAQKKAG